MPSHALKEPFTRTSNCTTMLQCSLSVIGNFRVDHAKTSSVCICGALVSSSILSDIHHGIRISLHVFRYRHWGFLSFSSLPSVGEKKNNTRKTATARLKQGRERFKLRSCYSIFRWGGQYVLCKSTSSRRRPHRVETVAESNEDVESTCRSVGQCLQTTGKLLIRWFCTRNAI